VSPLGVIEPRKRLMLNVERPTLNFSILLALALDVERWTLSV
jgi:hypothetical protein